MSEEKKLYRYRTDKEDAERQDKHQRVSLPGVRDILISVAEVREAHVRLTGQQALALLRLLERNRAALEQEAD